MEALPAAAFPRPTSLYVPERIDIAPPLVQTSSYSPFPTFPGAQRARDPYGLDQYLLHPDDVAWEYLQDDTGTPAEPPKPPRAKKSKPASRRTSFMLRRPSPLGSQDPVTASEGETSRPTSPQLLPRSHSVGDLDLDVFASAEVEGNAKATGSSSLSKALGLKRSKKESVGEPSTSSSEPLVLPERLRTLAEAFESDALVLNIARPSLSTSPSTPLSTRSNSAVSIDSSASSVSSSDEPKTPPEALMTLDLAFAGAKLATALEDESKRSSSRKWRSWLGVRKSSKSAAAKGLGSTGSADSSASPSPNASSLDLPAKLLETTSVDSTAEATNEAADLALERQQTTERLRKLSLDKLSQLRAPSPHPLLLSLRRQHAHLPEEVAFSFSTGGRAFPLSVNPRQLPGTGLYPGQGSLRINTGIKSIFSSLECGSYTSAESFSSSRPASVRSNSNSKVRSLTDFVQRPPFEDRMMVYFANGSLSPISMARHGYGIWDLDFSLHIQALADAALPASRLPIVPRPSFDISDDFEEAIRSYAEEASKLLETEDDIQEILKSPIPSVDTGIAPIAPDSSSQPAITITSESPDVDRPLSSFRNAAKRGVLQTWDDSDSESDIDADSSEPVVSGATAKVPFPASASVPTGMRTSGTLSTIPPYGRSRSQPDSVGLSVRPTSEVRPRLSRPVSNMELKVTEDNLNKHNLSELARARERRALHVAGESDRRAEKGHVPKQLRQQDPRASKQSASAPASPRRSRLSTAPSAPSLSPRSHRQHQHRSRPSSDFRPAPSSSTRPGSQTFNGQSARGGLPSTGHRSRYHSFYETSSARPTSMVAVPPYSHPAVHVFDPRYSIAQAFPMQQQPIMMMSGVPGMPYDPYAMWAQQAQTQVGVRRGPA